MYLSIVIILNGVADSIIVSTTN